MLTEEYLTACEARAAAATRWAPATATEFHRLARENVPALVAEVRRLSAPRILGGVGAGLANRAWRGAVEQGGVWDDPALTDWPAPQPADPCCSTLDCPDRVEWRITHHSRDGEQVAWACALHLTHWLAMKDREYHVWRIECVFA